MKAFWISSATGIPVKTGIDFNPDGNPMRKADWIKRIRETIQMTFGWRPDWDGVKCHWEEVPVHGVETWFLTVRDGKITYEPGKLVIK